MLDGWIHPCGLSELSKLPSSTPPCPPYSRHVPALPPSLPPFHSLGFYLFFYFHFSLLTLSKLHAFFFSLLLFRQLSPSQTFPPSLNMSRPKSNVNWKCAFSQNNKTTTQSPQEHPHCADLTRMTVFIQRSPCGYKRPALKLKHCCGLNSPQKKTHHKLLNTVRVISVLKTVHFKWHIHFKLFDSSFWGNPEKV